MKLLTNFTGMFLILLFFYGIFYSYQIRNKTLLIKSLVFNFYAWILFGTVIIFFAIYGTYFPFKYYQSARPLEFLLSWIPPLSLMIFTYLAYLGTSFIASKFEKHGTLIRISLTVLHCIVVCGLYVYIMFITCSLHTGECCC